MTDQTGDAGPDIRRQIAEYGAELMRFREMLDLAFAGGARSSKSPEDRVVFPLLVSCRDIVEEILFALNDGFGRAALRSARTMYECVVTARYLNLHPEKTDDFLAVFHSQWAKAVQNIPSQFRSSTSMHSDLAAYVPKYAQGKLVSMRDLNWSGKHTLEMAREAGALANLHSVAFDYASAFVHPSAMFVVRTLTQPTPDDNVFYVSVSPQDEEAKLALLVAHDLALNAVDLRLRYSPSGSLQNCFDECKQDFLRIWSFSPHI